jgi:hypothetical protein
MKDLRRLYLDKVFTPPDWLFPNLQFLCMSGSESYGCRSDTSDVDIMGIVIPPNSILYHKSMDIFMDLIHFLNLNLIKNIIYMIKIKNKNMILQYLIL